jgi:hypothetical protein
LKVSEDWGLVSIDGEGGAKVDYDGANDDSADKVIEKLLDP